MSHVNSFRLASYNIHKCVGLDRRRKPMRIIDVLNTLDADVIALQEVDRRLGDRPATLSARLIEDETDFRALNVAGSERSLGWHGNAILVRKDISAGTPTQIELPGTEPRGAISVPINGSLRLVATHLGLMRRDRRAQLNAIRAELGEAATGTVILGDFNEWSKTRGLEPLQGSFRVTSPGRSFHAARPLAALDKVATSHDIDLRDAGVCDSRKARMASDHLPVWADIRVAP